MGIIGIMLLCLVLLKALGLITLSWFAVFAIPTGIFLSLFVIIFILAMLGVIIGGK